MTSVADKPAEPRSMTIADLLVFIAGFAVVMKLVVPSPPAGGSLRWDELPILALFVLWTIAVAVALVTLERQIVYRRQTRPAEWLTILAVLISSFVIWIPDLDTAVRALNNNGQSPSPDFHAIRWLLASASLAVITAGGFVLLAFCNRLPGWIRTIFLAVLLAVWFWGPVECVVREFPQRTAPADGWRPRWLEWARVESFNIVQSVPFWLPVAVPAVAALIERRRRTRRWIWSEWLSSATVLTAGLLFLALFYWPVSGGASEDQIVLRIVMPIWILALGGFGWVAIRSWTWGSARIRSHNDEVELS